jgi:hypothetical protein
MQLKDRREKAVSHLGLGLVMLNFIAAAAITWMRLYDPGIDYGREMYVPWRLSEGEHLYRDIESLFGPLASLVNAGFYRLFGFSPTLLAWVNLVAVAVFLVLFYRWAQRWLGTRLAALLGISFIYLFAFANFSLSANFNFIMPYAHDTVYGLYALAGMVGWLTPVSGAVTRRRLAWAGFCFGLVWLTKVELLLAASVGLGVWFWLWHVRTRGHVGWCVLWLLSGFLLSQGILLGVLVLQGYEPRFWLTTLTGSFRLLLQANPMEVKYYQGVSGMGAPLFQLARIVQNSAAVGLLVAAAVLAAWHPPGWGKWKKSLAVALLVVGALWVAQALSCPVTALVHFGKAYQVWVGLVFVLVAWRSGVRKQLEEPGVAVFLVVAAVALALQAKIFLNSVIYHYGFFLSTGVWGVFLVLLFRLPDWVEIRGRRLADWPDWNARAYRFAVLTSVLVYVGIHVGLSLQTGWKRTEKPHWPGWEALAYDPSCRMSHSVFAAADWVDRHVPPAETVAVLPQGVLVNVVTRRRTPVPYQHVLPPELKLFGRGRMLEAFRSHPPDWILFVPDSREEIGDGFFGIEDYFPEFITWLKEEYERVEVFWPSGPEGPAVGCWRRKNV